MSEGIVQDRSRPDGAKRSAGRRHGKDRGFVLLCLVIACVSLVILAVLLSAIFVQGIRFLDADFLTSPPDPQPAEAGIWPALTGTVWICTICALATLPLGIATAVFLEEFQPTHVWLRRVHGFVQLNIANLAGVPSVVYGILGLTAFVQMFGAFGSPENPALEWGVQYYDQFLTTGDQVLLVPAEGPAAPMTEIEPGLPAITPDGRRVEVHVIGPGDPLPQEEALRDRTLRSDAQGGRISRKQWYYLRVPFGRGVLAGGLTLMLVILPILIISSQEALRAVPNSLRDAALGLGATPLQVVWRVSLPAALPGIMTGSILSMSRAIGEAAPILIVVGILFISSGPSHLMAEFTALPLQIFNWAGRPQQAFHQVAASGIIVLLAVLLCFNGLAVYIRHKLQRPLS